jgi:hypothetical protein
MICEKGSLLPSFLPSFLPSATLPLPLSVLLSYRVGPFFLPFE